MSRMTRRSILRAALFSGAAGLPLFATPGSAGRRSRGPDLSRKRVSSDKLGRFFGYVPFTQPVFNPEPLTRLAGGSTLDPTPGFYPGRPGGASQGPAVPTGDFSDVSHGIAPEFGHFPDMMDPRFRPGISSDHAVEFGLYIEETLHQFVPGGPDVPVFTYRDAMTPPGSGSIPGPTVIVNYREPAVLRCYNALTKNRGLGGDGQVNSTHHAHESSIHLHGGHNPAHSDGYPDFYTLAGEARDYWYTNCGPQRSINGVASVHGEDFDPAWIPTTLWYHDHAMDVTGFNVAKGLAGFYLIVDDRERELAEQGVLPEPGGPYDIGLVVADQRFNADGTIFYDFLDHNGRIGDVEVVNGRVQPYLEVERRKYRFRILNGANARVYELRLSSGQKMAIIGTDSWLLPRALEVKSFELSSGMRHDLIVDFSQYDDGDVVYLENIMIQTDGRKGKKVDPRDPTPLLQFRVVGGAQAPEQPVEDGTVIRGFAVDTGEGVDPNGQWAPITTDEIVKTRTFRFDRSMGAFTVNNRFFNPRRSDADTRLGVGAERWFIENKSGGWWHPIHTHLEGHQIHTIDGKLPRRERQYNQDLTLLHGGERAVALVKQRTFTGPFVMHCHTIEHEDMRMMAVIDPQPSDATPDAIDEAPPLDGETRIEPAVSGVVPDCIDLEHEKYLYFDVEGDLDRLNGRGVGFPECDFDATLRGNRGRVKK